MHDDGVCFVLVFVCQIDRGRTHIFSSSRLEFRVPPVRSLSRLDFVFESIVRLEVRRAVRAAAFRLRISYSPDTNNEQLRGRTRGSRHQRTDRTEKGPPPPQQPMEMAMAGHSRPQQAIREQCTLPGVLVSPVEYNHSPSNLLSLAFKVFDECLEIFDCSPIIL